MNKSFQDQLREVFAQAEDVGDETADKLAQRVAQEVDTLDEAMELIYMDGRFQEDLMEIRGVGKETLSNVVELSGAIFDGSYTIVEDSVDALRVVKEDYLETRNSKGNTDEDGSPKQVDDPAHMNG